MTQNSPLGGDEDNKLWRHELLEGPAALVPSAMSKVRFVIVKLERGAGGNIAEESVAKYHEGTFMGNKIRVELSHGGGRTAKYTGDPGACFKCGQLGHWAR